MNTFKQSLLAKSIAAAAIAAAGVGTPSASHAITASGGPASGMVCRTGYTAAFSGTNLKCSKTSRITVQMVCADPRFNNYVARVVAGGTQQGEDVCAKSGGQVSFDSDDSIGGGTSFTRGVDWELAKADKVKIDEKTVARDLEEAAAIGGTAADVETVAGETVFNRQANGIIDNASVTLTHFTFAVSARGPIVVGTPTPGPTPFVPRPLP